MSFDRSMSLVRLVFLLYKKKEVDMDVYSMVTDRIIKQLEEGTIPWHKPWVGCMEGAFNRISRKPYSIMNQILLGQPGEWGTLRQWSEIGGKVRKGSKASMVVFWKLQEKKDRNEHGEEVVRMLPVLRYYNVFHIDQVENVLPLQIDKTFPTEPIEEAEKFFREYIEREHITLREGHSGRAFYCPTDDSITIPGINQFEKSEEFYGVAFHESSHSTLKKCRCDREAENRTSFFGDEEYSKEELVAEISSAAILHSLGIETECTFQNSAAYIESWLHVLKNDKRMIVSASGKAEKSAKYILGIN